MLGQYLIAFRETLEASLIVSIILSYLIRTGRWKLAKYVFYGTCFAVALSVIFGLLVWNFYGKLAGSSQVLFEASSAFLAVAILSTMIVWMASKGKSIGQELERKVERTILRGAATGLTSTTFIVVFREGFETITFLTPFFIEDPLGTFYGSLGGVLIALILAYGMFVAGVKISLRKIFYFTSIILVLLAGGLAGYGTHELIEYYESLGVEFGWLAEPAYTLNLEPGSPLHHNGFIGSIFAVMIGYSVRPEWARIIIQSTYTLIMIFVTFWIYRSGDDQNLAASISSSST
jgi:high-affinity iron transporter